MLRKTMMGVLFGCLCLLVAGCLTAVDGSLPYTQLPTINLATDVRLVASPSHPTAYLASDPIPAGTQVQVIGADKDAAWLLVLHDNLLGWMPTFFSKTNVGTLTPAFVFDPLASKCTQYLSATYQPDAAWISNVDGSIIVIGSVYRPQAGAQFEDAALAIEINGPGKASKADYVHTPLTPSSAVILFAFSVESLQKNSQIKFRLTDPDNEPIAFEAAFFSDTCAQQPQFAGELPIGKPKVAVARSTPTAQVHQESTATEQPTEEGTPIVHLSDSRTPTSAPTPTPFPTLDSKLYGETVAITAATASSTLFTRDYEAIKAVDGDILSYWASEPNHAIGAWLELQLPEPRLISGLRIYIPQGEDGLGVPRDISMSFSDNSKQSIHLDATEGWQYKSLASVTTQKVRLVIDGVYKDNFLNTADLHEIQLFSKPLPPPQIIETGNPAVSIQLRSGLMVENAQKTGRLKARFLLYDAPIISRAAITLFSLDQDVAGAWIRGDKRPENPHADDKGFYTVDLPPQQYLLTGDFSTDEQPIVPGWYSDRGLDDGKTANGRGIIFPMEAGKITEIEVQFSRLVVGVLNEAGKAMRGTEYADWRVSACSTVIGDSVDDAEHCAKSAIDKRGAATFYLTPGDYQLHVLRQDACYWQFPIKVGLKEAKVQNVTINSQKPDACPVGQK